ncbi:MAG: DUF4340 domain-containing protein [Dehalococcoidia bacterium]|nr:DUF4340 domain-containing protein [Dehalococcoidia bacterium]
MNRAGRRATREGRTRQFDARRREQDGPGFFSRRLLLGVSILGVLSVGVVGAIIANAGNDVATPSLSSLTRLSALNIDQIVIEKEADRLTIDQKGGFWSVGDHTGNRFKIDFAWDLLSQIDQAQSIPSDEAQHTELGLTSTLGTTVSFWKDGVFVDSLIVGNFNEEAGGTFLRHPSADSIAAVGFDLEQFFSPLEDDWRDNVIVNAGSVLVESLKFTYPEETFTVALRVDEDDTDATEAEEQTALRRQAAVNAAILTGQPIPDEPEEDQSSRAPLRFSWILETEVGDTKADTGRVLEMMGFLSPLFATEFADEEWEALSQREADWSLEMSGTGLGSLAHLSFYKRDGDEGFFVRKTGLQEIFVVDTETVESLMKRPRELQALLDIESGP